MPIHTSTYQARWPFRYAHINTIYPALFRTVAAIPFQREQLDTPDGDFLDLDRWSQGSKQLIIGLHGLEGSADRPYLRGLFRHFYRHGWDVLGMNFRSCSGRLNRKLRTYNMGESHDLYLTVQYAIAKGYTSILLAGFSLGGNVVLKFMGESGPTIPTAVKGAVVFSVPCHLPTAEEAIAHPRNFIYVRRFLSTLNQKMKSKVTHYPQQLQAPERLPRTFKDFDGQFTAPIHGYTNEKDYYHSCASIDFMPNICRPTLLINALDDTFLSPECYPHQMAEKNPYLHLETPMHGGHCGFYSPRPDGSYWTDRRALAFAQEMVKMVK
jgi:predicted alpha/beta-fold hydrolase